MSTTDSKSSSSTRSTKDGRRRIKPDRVIDILSDDTQVALNSTAHSPSIHPTHSIPIDVAPTSDTIESKQMSLHLDRTINSPNQPTRLSSPPLTVNVARSNTPLNRALKRKHSELNQHNGEVDVNEETKEAQSEETETREADLEEDEEVIEEEKDENESGDEDHQIAELYDDNDSNMEDEEECKEPSRGSSNIRKPSKSPAAASSSDPPLIPFIFQTSHGNEPSEAERKAADRIIQDRLSSFLSGVEQVDTTTAQQRYKMSKDRLLQRNLEIQACMISLDREYDLLLNSKPFGWEHLIRTLDERNDILAEESDEIETLLFEKFRVIGGGRSLLSDEIVAAGEFGGKMAEKHRERGLPIPKLSIPVEEEKKEQTTHATAKSSTNNTVTSHTAELLPVKDDDDMEMSTNDAVPSPVADTSDSVPPAAADSTSSSTAKPSKSFKKGSRSDAAMFAKLDAEQEATRVRRVERKEKQKESILGKYFEHFNKFIDVEPPKRHSTPRKAKVPPRPAAFTLYLGTLVFPMFTEDDGIRVEFDDTEMDSSVDESKDESKDESVEMKVDFVSSSKSTLTSAPTASSSTLAATSHARGQKRRYSDIGEETEEGAEDDSIGEDHISGEQVWLDFSHDKSYVDGCIVKQVRSTSNMDDGEGDETIIVGVLPLDSLHPESNETDEPDEFDDNGNLISKKPKSKQLPDPKHPLAALYILHEASIIRLESTLIRSSHIIDSSNAIDSRDHIEVSILVNGRIFDTQLLRSIAQKEALRTLFRLFAPENKMNEDSQEDTQNVSTAAATTDQPTVRTLYPNRAGRMVLYSELTESERRVVAFTDIDDDGQTHQHTVPTVPVNLPVKDELDDGPRDMELDSDEEEKKDESATIVKKEPCTTSSAVSGTTSSCTPSTSIQRTLNGQKRRKIEPMHLSLIDQSIDGDEIGESEDDLDEDEDVSVGDESESDTDDSLFDPLEEDEFVFVDLKLPNSTHESLMEDVQKPPVVPSASPIKSESDTVPESSPIPSQVTEDEISSYKQIVKRSAELDEKGIDKPSNTIEPLTEEEKQLELESKAVWRPDSLHSLFESIRPTPKWKKSVAQPDKLISTLRPFQQKALAWMIHRESERHETYTDPLWQTSRLNGRTIWYQPFAGIISKESPPIFTDVRGGILSDEMGLGKTVVSIALIAKCPMVKGPLSPRAKAMVKREPKPTNSIIVDESDRPQLSHIGATLIVSPQSLVYQWQKEISIHAPTLKVLVYEGTNQVKTPEVAQRIYQENMEKFAAADIILATYAVLGHEVNYSKECQYSFRGAKQYAVPKSPLLDSHFHRVLLDEAQMVHSSLSVCFQMASRLSSTSRFCVSGTPIGPQGLHDLYGLVSFLGFKEYESVTIWRSAMRSSTPEGLERLRSLLKRIMWRHSKAHVIDEVCIPKLHVSKIYLDFSKVEAEFYSRLESQCQSNVYFETRKGRLVDRTAMNKLEALRQACAHPQASSGTFLGKEIRTIPEIGQMLVKRVTDEAASCERDLCRAMNKLATEYRRQGLLDLAEVTFAESWKIADSGVSIETQKSEGSTNAVAAMNSSPVKDRNSTSAMAAAADALTKSSKSLDAFETHTNIVTQNSQVRQWRMIELITTYQLACIYRDQLKRQYNYETPAVEVWRELPTETFDRIMAETELQVPAFRSSEAVKSAAAAVAHAAEQASNMLPPQLAAAAAFSSSAAPAAATASSIAIDVEMESSEGLADPFTLLKKKFHRQFEQFKYNLHDLFDLLEEKLNKEAALIRLTYEEDLLPKCLDVATTEVQDLAKERAKIGLVEFNRLSNPHIATVERMINELEREQEVHHTVLEVYDLNRSLLLIKRLQQRLKKWTRRRNHDEMLIELKAVLKERLSKQPFYPQMQRKLKGKPEEQGKRKREPRNLDEQLDAQCKGLERAIRKHMTRTLTSDLVAQLEKENDMTHVNFEFCQHRAKYETAWQQARDSIQALRIMKEIKTLREKMRVYIQKMLRLRLTMLRDQSIITPNEALDLMTKVSEDVSIEDEDFPGDDGAGRASERDEESPRKKQKLNHAAPSPQPHPGEEKQPVMDVDDDQDMVARPAPSSAPSAASSSREYVDTDTAISRDVMHDSVTNHLKRDIAVLQTRAKAMHTNVKWLKNQFGMLTSEAAVAVRNHICSICKSEITQPTLTKCGHFYDGLCLEQWVKRNASCPDCRCSLFDGDWAEFSASELPAAIRHETTLIRRSSSQPAAVSTATVPASASSHDSLAAKSDPDSEAKTLEDALQTTIVGEGRHGSKVEAICKYIKYLHKSDPTVKVLVFSQYHRMLDMVGAALSQNNIESLHLAGTPLQRAKQIDRFQKDPKLTAFLMSLRTDNSGLTLVDARAVFLMEPSLNPAIEAQAVNRIHRIGQTRETRVFKFLMRNSVEQQIDEMAALTNNAGQAEVPVQTEGAALVHQSKESLSVSQLLRVLNLVDADPAPADVPLTEEQQLLAATTRLD